MNVFLRACPLVFVSCCFPLFVLAQTTLPAVDSVVVTGRIRNLSGRLYRESPTVLISRNNILDASRELVRPAPLNVDGTFRVALPLLYAQEELYFNYGRIATAFLAAPGAVTIDLNADSLFTAAVPFRFGGVNAQVNQQFARYKAFEATYPNKPDAEKLSTQISGPVTTGTFTVLRNAYQQPFADFARKEKPYLLVARWVGSTNRYSAAQFLYDRLIFGGGKQPAALNDSLRPPDDRLLTAARASAMNRFATYATQLNAVEAGRASGGLSVRTLASLLLRYGRNLTDDEQLRLQEYIDRNTARAADLRFFDSLIKRSNDTIQRLVSYETIIRRSREQFDSVAVGYITAYGLASTLPGLTLDFAKLLYSYARPQITDPQLAQSLDELYRLEVKDSVRIRSAVQTLKRAGSRVSSLEISPGVFVTRNPLGDGSVLFDQTVNANRGKVVYVLLTSTNDAAGRQAALDAQRLRSTYRSRDLALVYVPMPGDDADLWAEFAAKHNLAGDHLLLTQDQYSDVQNRLRPEDAVSATVISRVGKIVKRNAPIPGAFEEAKKLIDKNL